MVVTVTVRKHRKRWRKKEQHERQSYRETKRGQRE
jgi:hypothetical protein